MYELTIFNDSSLDFKPESYGADLIREPSNSDTPYYLICTSCGDKAYDCDCGDSKPVIRAEFPIIVAGDMSRTGTTINEPNPELVHEFYAIVTSADLREKYGGDIKAALYACEKLLREYWAWASGDGWGYELRKNGEIILAETGIYPGEKNSIYDKIEYKIADKQLMTYTQLAQLMTDHQVDWR